LENISQTSKYKVILLCRKNYRSINSIYQPTNAVQALRVCACVVVSNNTELKYDATEATHQSRDSFAQLT